MNSVQDGKRQGACKTSKSVCWPNDWKHLRAQNSQGCLPRNTDLGASTQAVQGVEVVDTAPGKGESQGA